MYYKFFSTSEISSSERAMINQKIKDFVVDLSGFLPSKYAVKNLRRQNASESQNDKANAEQTPKINLNDLRAERIPGAVEPRIEKPKNNIFDKKNNERLLKEFREAGLKAEPEPNDTTDAV